MDINRFNKLSEKLRYLDLPDDADFQGRNAQSEAKSNIENYEGETDFLKFITLLSIQERQKDIDMLREEFTKSGKRQALIKILSFHLEVAKHEAKILERK